MCNRFLDSGAYVLGALAPTERESYERHLADCAACRQEVAELAVMPGLLGRLEPTAVELGAADGDATIALPRVPVTLLPKLLWAARLERSAQRRRGRRRALVAALAAACLTVLAVLGVKAADDTWFHREPAEVAMRPVAAGAPISAEIALVPFSGGTDIRMHCEYVSKSHEAEHWMFRLYVYPRGGGEPEQVATWSAGYGQDVRFRAVSRLTPAEIGKIELRGNEDTPMLVYEKG
jgi:hypothetical protein